MAMEQIDHAEDLLKMDTFGLTQQEQECRNQVRDTLQKYHQAVKIFNEYAKARYQGDEATAEKFALSDGTAKWTMADTLMAKYLADGCKGGLFIFVQDQNPEFRRRVFESYQAFYGESFDSQRARFSLLLGYLAPAENRPSGGLPPSPPTKIFTFPPR